MSLVDELYAAVPPLLARHTFARPIHTPVRPALHGDASGVRGAAWLAR
jgi:fructokinase